MVSGLAVYKPSDRIFNCAFVYQGVLSGLATGAWYAFASKYKIICCQRMLNRSITVAFLLSLLFMRGPAQQIVAYSANVDKEEQRKNDNYLDYRIELRNKKIIE